MNLYNSKILWDIDNCNTLCLEYHKNTDTFGNKSNLILFKNNKDNYARY